MCDCLIESNNTYEGVNESLLELDAIKNVGILST